MNPAATSASSATYSRREVVLPAQPATSARASPGTAAPPAGPVAAGRSGREPQCRGSPKTPRRAPRDPPAEDGAKLASGPPPPPGEARPASRRRRRGPARGAEQMVHPAATDRRRHVVRVSHAEERRRAPPPDLAPLRRDHRLGVAPEYSSATPGAGGRRRTPARARTAAGRRSSSGVPTRTRRSSGALSPAMSGPGPTPRRPRSAETPSVGRMASSPPRLAEAPPRLLAA